MRSANISVLCIHTIFNIMYADLEAALTLDPNSQETIALIRRTEPIVLKLQQKRTEELELEKKKAEEVERQKTTYVKSEPGNIH